MYCLIFGLQSRRFLIARWCRYDVVRGQVEPASVPSGSSAASTSFSSPNCLPRWRHRYDDAPCSASRKSRDPAGRLSAPRITYRRHQYSPSPGSNWTSAPALAKKPLFARACGDQATSADLRRPNWPASNDWTARFFREQLYSTSSAGRGVEAPEAPPARAKPLKRAREVRQGHTEELKRVLYRCSSPSQSPTCPLQVSFQRIHGPPALFLLWSQGFLSR